jgi:hypothetical protein
MHNYFSIYNPVLRTGCLSRIPDTKTAAKEKGGIFFSTLFGSHKEHKIKNYFIFEQVKKKFTSYKEFFIQNMSLSSQKYGFGIRDPEKTYSESRSQKVTGSRIRTRNTVTTLKKFKYQIQ